MPAAYINGVALPQSVIIFVLWIVWHMPTDIVREADIMRSATNQQLQTAQLHRQELRRTFLMQCSFSLINKRDGIISVVSSFHNERSLSQSIYQTCLWSPYLWSHLHSEGFNKMESVRSPGVGLGSVIYSCSVLLNNVCRVNWRCFITSLRNCFFVLCLWWMLVD